MNDELYLKELESLRSRLESLRSRAQQNFYGKKSETLLHIYSMQLAEKILDVKHSMHEKVNFQSKIASLEKELAELRQMIEHFPGSGSAYLAAKSEFELHTPIERT